MKVKEIMDLEHIFGDLGSRVIWSNNPLLQVNDEITIVNSNCEFEYDSILRQFDKGLIYGFVVELELIEVDLSEYEPTKSNNGGGYAFAHCKVVKILEEGY